MPFKKAYTMIELVVSVAIIIIISFISLNMLSDVGDVGIPSLFNFGRNFVSVEIRCNGEGNCETLRLCDFSFQDKGFLEFDGLNTSNIISKEKNGFNIEDNISIIDGTCRLDEIAFNYSNLKNELDKRGVNTMYIINGILYNNKLHTINYKGNKYSIKDGIIYF